MKFYPALFITALAAILSAGCNIINPAEKIPTYIHIDSFSFKVNDPVEEGSASQKIIATWVYLDNDPIGCFDLPATVPVLMDKPGKIKLSPGVTMNGMSDYVAQYSFFVPDTMTLAPAPGSIVKLNPKTSYYPDTRFQWKENFDISNPFVNVNADLTDDTTLVRTTQQGQVFEGNGSGLITLTTAHSYSENITNDGFSIPNVNAYLEINYKCNVQFVVGLQTTINGTIIAEYITGANPKAEWNKLYISLDAFLSTYKASAYRLIIRAVLPEGQSDGYVLIDNLKIVTF